MLAAISGLLGLLTPTFVKRKAGDSSMARESSQKKQLAQVCSNSHRLSPQILCFLLAEIDPCEAAPCGTGNRTICKPLGVISYECSCELGYRGQPPAIPCKAISPRVLIYLKPKNSTQTEEDVVRAVSCALQAMDLDKFGYQALEYVVPPGVVKVALSAELAQSVSDGLEAGASCGGQSFSIVDLVTDEEAVRAYTTSTTRYNRSLYALR
jgi:hypothetical protein